MVISLTLHVRLTAHVHILVGHTCWHRFALSRLSHKHLHNVQYTAQSFALHAMFKWKINLQYCSECADQCAFESNRKWSLNLLVLILIYGSKCARAYSGNPCDSFNRLAKKLITHLAYLLSRTPGIRHSAQNRLPLRSTREQSRTPCKCRSFVAFGPPQVSTFVDLCFVSHDSETLGLV